MTTDEACASSALDSAIIPPKTQMGAFARRISDTYGVDCSTYQRLHAWSICEIESFWAEVWDFFDVKAGSPYEKVLDSRTMPGAQWFTGARLNYVDQILKHAQSAPGPAIVVVDEALNRREVSWFELVARITSFAEFLRSAGVRPGDRVVGYLPNSDEAIIAFLASAAVGATWAVCGPDYGAEAAAERLAQLQPKVLIAVTATVFSGRTKDRREVLAELVRRLDPEIIVTVERAGQAVAHDESVGRTRWFTWLEATESDAADHDLVTEKVDPDHPLWVLFSSGTTGVPKGIVHGHAGVLLTHLASLGLHQDLDETDTLFWYTTTNWMLWNVVVGALLVGATTVTYEGSPSYPDVKQLWRIVEHETVTQFGTSPGLLQGSRTAGLRPVDQYDLSALTAILATGAPVPGDLNSWVAEAVSADVPLISTSGGTDIVSSFIGGSPGLPVRAGQISGPLLGVAIEAWNGAGHAVRDEVGELVVTLPMPSMPVGFWNDASGERLHSSYFDMFDGVWRHGDWITHTSEGAFIVHGRSDSTLNRNGVRIGSADLYRVAEAVDGVAETLVVGVEMADGSYRMPMFVELNDPTCDVQEIFAQIAARLRSEVSPRHVPDEFHIVKAIPHTTTGKKLEVPVKRILQGARVDEALSVSAVDRPELFDFYVELAGRWADSE